MPDNFVRIPPFKVKSLLRANELREVLDWPGRLYGLPDLWKRSKGRGVVVAVLDSGVEVDHPDFILPDGSSGIDKVWPDNEPHRDSVGHGTHVATTLGARENGMGIIGIAPECTLRSYRVLDEEGNGDMETLAVAIKRAVDDGADIVSMSLGSPDDSHTVLEAINYGIRRSVIFVAAAGNSGTPNSVEFPGRLAQVIGVGSFRRDGRVSEFSSRGSQVDIMGPGEDILGGYPPKRYAKLDGTSMATPFVAGSIALYISACRQASGESDFRPTVAQIAAVLKDTAKDAGSPGHDSDYGYGLIQPGALVTEAEKASRLGSIPVSQPSEPQLVLRMPASRAGVRGYCEIFFRSDPNASPNAAGGLELAGG